MKQSLKPIPAEEILHFIRAYRTLERMPLEDGFAHLRAVSPVLPGEDEAEVKELRQHFRNQWYTKKRHFGLFF